MRIVKPFATGAVVLGLGLSSAWVAVADSNDGAYQRSSQVRQAVANDSGESADDLVLPELDKPASLKQNKSNGDRESNGDRNYAAPRSGSVSRQSQVRQTSGVLPADPRHPAVDSLPPDGNDPDAPQAAPQRRARPAVRNASQSPADYAPVQRGNYQQAPDYQPAPRCAGRNTSGYSVNPGPQPAPYTNKYSPNYRPAYAEQAAPISNQRSAAAYNDRVAQAARPYPGSAMQSSADYRPGARFAARYEPTPAAPDGSGPPSAASASVGASGRSPFRRSHQSMGSARRRLS